MVRFSIDDEALNSVDCGFRDDSSEVEMVGVGSDAAGASPISVVATEEALYGASLGQWTLVCGGCGE
jgi:hypothetical protein